MKTVITKLFAGSLITAVFSVCAQEPADDLATLRVERGAAMTSSGGDFVTANTGEAVVEGERLMVSENSVVTVVYSNDCERRYDTPGVYRIEPDCDRAVVSGMGWKGTAIIGAVAVAAVVLANDSGSDDDDDD